MEINCYDLHGDGLRTSRTSDPKQRVSVSGGGLKISGCRMPQLSNMGRSFKKEADLMSLLTPARLVQNFAIERFSKDC